jgi:glycosyltransferase involved in cell wall biosynthesis
MKWNWFCPLPPAKTGIADYCAQVLPFLCSTVDVTLWTDQRAWDPFLEERAEVRSYDRNDIPWKAIHRADLSIFHIGNNEPFHGGIWEVARHCPGLVVLHDPTLHHFFFHLYRDHLYRERWNARSAYLKLMRRYYGESSLHAATKFFEGRLSSEFMATEFMAERFPLTDHALENALGVVVHSREMFARLKAEDRLPVAYAPLPYLARSLKKADDFTKSKKTARIIVFGYLGSNRRLEQILRAVADLRAGKQLHLDICGEVVNAEKLHNLIVYLKLTEAVSVRGFLSDSELDLALAGSDMAVNLRYPTMGEASLSLLRIWEHALPAMVTRVGWYATLSDEVVCFVRPENEIDDIKNHLRHLLEDPEYFRAKGLRARRLLEAGHSPQDYVNAIVTFVDNIRGSIGVAQNYLADRVGAIAGQWMEEPLEGQAIANAARQIFVLTGQERNSDLRSSESLS